MQHGVYQFGIRLDGTLDYPTKLYDADYPLALLYFQGNWDLVFSRGIAVVGTRSPTEEGIKRTKRLVSTLVNEGFTIYSGLATSIDTAAHIAAIENGGYTIAVTGTPLWFSYPEKNAALQQEIAKNHLLISQVPKIDESLIQAHSCLESTDYCCFLSEYASGQKSQYSETNQLIINLKKPMDRKQRPTEWFYK